MAAAATTTARSRRRARVITRTSMRAYTYHRGTDRPTTHARTTLVHARTHTYTHARARARTQLRPRDAPSYANLASNRASATDSVGAEYRRNARDCGRSSTEAALSTRARPAAYVTETKRT